MGKLRPGIPPSEAAAWQRTYEKSSYRDLPWFSPRPYGWVRENVVAGVFRPRSRILDLGCGAGTNSLFLARSRFRVSGIDLAPERSRRPGRGPPAPGFASTSESGTPCVFRTPTARSGVRSMWDAFTPCLSACGARTRPSLRACSAREERIFSPGSRASTRSRWDRRIARRSKRWPSPSSLDSCSTGPSIAWGGAGVYRPTTPGSSDARPRNRLRSSRFGSEEAAARWHYADQPPCGTVAAELRIGCSSWTSDAWWGKVYPEGIPDGERLRHYARKFNAVEVDSTYYRPRPRSSCGPGRARRRTTFDSRSS